MARRNQSPASEVHLQRYYRSLGGETITEIAEKDKVTEETVKESIHAVKIYRQRRNVETLNEAVAGTLLDVVPEIKKSIKRQLEATVIVEDKMGRKSREPDYAVQRGAVSEVRGLLTTIQPKAPNVHATQVNVGQQGGSAPRLASGSYHGMEDRLKAITEQLETQPAPENRKQLVQAPLQPIEEAEYEEAEEVEA